MPFNAKPNEMGVMNKVAAKIKELGMYTFVRWNYIFIAPPLCITKAEIDVTTIRRADHIVCDSIDACRIEAGDFVAGLTDGSLDWNRVRELSDVVVGQETGRATAQDITLFKSVGLGLEDLAVAVRVFQRAQTEGIGQTLPF